MNTTDLRRDDEQGPPHDDRLLAGEYVLGVLDARERAAVQARLANEPSLAAEVDAWEAHFAPWLEQGTPMPPASHVWPLIQSRLGWDRAATAAVPSGLWNSLRFWRAATALAAAASVAAVVLALQWRVPSTPPAPVAVRPAPTVEAAAKPVTVLAGDDGRAGWVAAIDTAAGKVLMVPVVGAADAPDRANELWLIAPGRAPQSLGFVSGTRAHSLPVPSDLRALLAVGATLAITVEPPSPTPHDAPTGPVIAKGDIRQI